jgi:uncharacterized protein (TIGR02145 family)
MSIKKSLLGAVSVVATVSLLAVGIAGCGEKANPGMSPATPKYDLTVLSAGTGATSNGSYAEGATVAIKAGTPPAGNQFINWTFANDDYYAAFANERRSTTTFIMPNRNITVVANFLPLGTFTDHRDNAIYNTVNIGNHTWMAENLRYQTSSGSWCYGDDSINCDTYGRLYDWATAKTVCPDGWHLPYRAEWDDLFEAIGTSFEHKLNLSSLNNTVLNNTVIRSFSGGELKSADGWNGYNDYGFSALSGGYRRVNSTFMGEYHTYGSLGTTGDWWTATDSGGVASGIFMGYVSSGTAYDGGWTSMQDLLRVNGLGSGEYMVFENAFDKSFGFSVRCVKD